MKNSAAFLEAYRLLLAGEEKYTCDAILRASAGRAPGALLVYRELFTPYMDSPEHYWLRNTGMGMLERREWRLTALTLAAAIAKSENT